ncbi:hypothetical protein [Ekhidna sp.]|uniref:hypothetical protein n=1 Tax=Ekhidna sp. TaxID=2608089 RepID=UPI0032984C21
MLIPFEEMPNNARLWIYQAERKLSKEQVQIVETKTEEFLTQWRAHGQDLKSSFQVEYDQFLVITVDESFSQASGCSIDASVHLIKALESALNISFMTTSQVAFLQNDKINLYPFNQLKAQAREKVITPDTLVFDNTVQNIAEFKSRWLQESSATWLNRYFQ